VDVLYAKCPGSGLWRSDSNSLMADQKQKLPHADLTCLFEFGSTHMTKCVSGAVLPA